MQLPEPKTGRYWRHGLRLVVLVGVIWAMHGLSGWIDASLHREGAAGSAADPVMLATILALYALLIATPFVPGVEIGIATLMIWGAAAAPAVYGATVAGLLLAFAGGRLVPQTWLSSLLADSGLSGTADRLAAFAQMPPAARLQLLAARLPRRLRPLVRSRYLILGLLLNLPGSTLMGGGGGIMLLAGCSRLFTGPWLVLTVLVAVAPVPLAIWLTGLQPVLDILQP